MSVMPATIGKAVPIGAHPYATVVAEYILQVFPVALQNHCWWWGQSEGKETILIVTLCQTPHISLGFQFRKDSLRVRLVLQQKPLHTFELQHYLDESLIGWLSLAADTLDEHLMLMQTKKTAHPVFQNMSRISLWCVDLMETVRVNPGTYFTWNSDYRIINPILAEDPTARLDDIDEQCLSLTTSEEFYALVRKGQFRGPMLY